MFARYENVKRKRCENEKGFRKKEMSRQKVSNETILTERGFKIKVRNNRKQE